jgi:DinB superfamily
MPDIVQQYLDLLDSQREAAFAALEGLTEAQIWQRPAPKEWCLGEILDHNYLLIGSTFPYVKVAWKLQKHRAERRRVQPYDIYIEDPYRKSSFPMWVGFLWKPRYTPKHPVPLEKLKAENRDLHTAVRLFYSDKDPALLGNIFVYDPLFGSINLIVTLRIGIYHDQLHFDDVFKMAAEMRSK